MRAVKRDLLPGPASLLTPGRPGPSELARAIEHYSGAQAKTFSFGAYKGDDVRHGLEALFHGKCAYCESRYDVSGPVDIEHYRPKGGIDGVPGHPGYWWLAAEWTNLLPSCLDCNRRRYQQTPEEFASLSGALDAKRKAGLTLLKTGKETCFPLAGMGVRMATRPDPLVADAALAAEQALLLDPCRDDPSRHLRFHIDREAPLGIVYPAGNGSVMLPVLPAPTNDVQRIENDARQAQVSVRGAVSIQVYGLNRLALVQERTRLLRKLEFLGSVVLEMSAVADNLTEMKVAKAAEPIRDYAVERARAIVNRAIAEIRGLAKPDAPFSAMVRSWIDVFKTDAATPTKSPSAPLGWAAAPLSTGDPGLGP